MKWVGGGGLVKLAPSPSKKLLSKSPALLGLNKCKYIEGKVMRHINDNLSDFSSSDESDDSNEE